MANGTTVDLITIQVAVYENVTEESFKSVIQPQRKPAVLKGIHFGECVNNWTAKYLIEKVGSLPVKVHASNEGKMDFLTKNFIYKTLLFNEFIKLVSNKSSGVLTDKDSKLEKFYYLRSLSSERRGKKEANIINEFPSIANDIQLPNFYDIDKFFSSILRIGSAGVQVWTHYDVMDNILIQIQGRKRVILFSPSDAPYMYLNGDKSEVLDIENPDFNKYPKFKLTTRYECVLEKGDILFIPALWFHNTLALTYGVNVNVFWKNLEVDLYDKNDFYGNKDLVPAAKMLQMVTKSINELNVLPEEYRDFYARRAIIIIEKLIRNKDDKCDNKDNVN